ncbi:hypothetical protein HMPREF9057_02762 [Actinomyces sp. oral taxon 171 str. F0337]|nr:hypothetical protein HMPREF9057_02762 [Actinomyces sp. oral taxon 171 str. F0337]
MKSIAEAPRQLSSSLQSPRKEAMSTSGAAKYGGVSSPSLDVVSCQTMNHVPAALIQGRKCVSDVAAEEAGRTRAVSVQAIRVISHVPARTVTGVVDSLRRRSASGRATMMTR